ncbi:MAG: thioredoxin family protein [Planctomycetota bacterium]|jgi:peroxiredoxin
MTATASQMLPLGTLAEDFSLPDCEGKIVSLSDFKDVPALLIVFMCNHCPYVIHVVDNLVKLIKEYQAKGVAAVAISSNDIIQYPEDCLELMASFAREHDFSFPYLYDESQKVAKAYHAACTPDFFVFDSEHALAYRGQMDNSRPGNDVPVTGDDLRAALDAVLNGQKPTSKQFPSLGCNIKWKSGNEPDYA